MIFKLILNIKVNKLMSKMRAHCLQHIHKNYKEKQLKLMNDDQAGIINTT